MIDNHLVKFDVCIKVTGAKQKDTVAAPHRAPWGTAITMEGSLTNSLQEKRISYLNLYSSIGIW